MLASRRMRKGRQGLALCLAATWLLEACSAGWRQPADPVPTPFEPRQQVQVWQQDSVVRWHAVTVTADTVSGIPFLEPIDCESCRVAVPRATVDSIRVGHPVAAFWGSVGLVVGTILAVCFIACPRDAT